MKVSVIIPTYNGEHYLSQLMKILQQQTVTFELIIIDSSSTDNTRNIVAPYADKVITIPQNKFDHGGTRQKALQEASGEILIFLTQDALPDSEDTFAKILSIFDHAQVSAAYGRQLAYDTTNIFGKHLRAFNYPGEAYIRELADKEKYGIKTAFLSDSFAAYRKSMILEVGGFKSGLIFGEDTHIASKLLFAGYSIAYVAEARVYHSHSYTWIQEFQRYFDMGVFHIKEGWILDIFGKAEGEGLTYLKSEWAYLLKHYAYAQIPAFFIRNGLKYIGYKMGKRYKLFPKKIVRKCSMHTSWWDT